MNFKAMPQPNFEKVFRPQLKHARTEPKAFSFEEKDKERWQKKEEKIQDTYKEEERVSLPPPPVKSTMAKMLYKDVVAYLKAQ